MMRIVILAQLLLASTPAHALQEKQAAYEVRSLEGWQVHLGTASFEGHASLRKETLRELSHQLARIARVVPAPRLADLQRVPIWVERETPNLCMAFHPARQWLFENGYEAAPNLPAMVELGNAENFLDWTLDQPSMVLHELAHGLDFLVLGEGDEYGNALTKEGFSQALYAETYESVLRYNGERERHYALDNRMEYFAEASEAFFGVNDFYPFVRAELAAHDESGFRMVASIYGVDLEAEKRRAADLAKLLERSRERAVGTVRPESTGFFGGFFVRLPRGFREKPDELLKLNALLSFESRLLSRFVPENAWSRLSDIELIAATPKERDLYAEYRPRRGALGWIEFDLRALDEFIGLQPSAFLHGIARARFAALSRAQREEVEARWSASRELYASVLRFDGKQVPHPAQESAELFFAELSEALLYANDHMPFVEAELLVHDPETHALLRRIWGE